MFITFEGIDGASKSTQIELLKNYFIEQGKEVLAIREPGGLKFSENIRNILLSNDTNINNTTELLLFLSARSELTEKVILPALNEDKIVICDRFYDSTYAYQGFGRGIDLDKIIQINKIATQNLTPDLTFYLHISIETSLSRNIEKHKDRMESNTMDFMTKVKYGFDAIAQMYSKRVKVINAEKNVDNIHREIQTYLEK